jgi:FG-GAP repeat
MLGAGWPRHGQASSTPVAAPASHSASASLPAFRLGTAAGPFGWSTAIGDFNSDGTPDIAIADRVSRPMGGSAYRIQFSVSGLAPKTFAFRSDQDALTVRVSDIDHDNDLDVVLSGALSHEIVGVWLNDGRGGFEAADIRHFASELRALQSVDAPDPSVDPSGSVLVPRRSTDGLPLLVRRTPPIARRSLCNSQQSRFHPVLLSAAAASRAPPEHSAYSFS